MADPWDEAPIAGGAVAPKPAPQAVTGSDPWDAAPLVPGSSARAKAVVNSNVSPDDAGRAVNISKQTGVPPSIVQTDLPGYDAHAKTQSAIKAIENPAIASYIDKDSMASQVSNDDYSVLDRISGVFSKLHKDAVDHATALELADQVPAVNDLTKSEPGREKLRGYLERMKSGFIGGFGEESVVNKFLREAHEQGLNQNVIQFYEGSGLAPTARAVEGAIRLFPGLVGGAFGVASGVAEQVSGSSAWADRLLREAPGANAALMGLGASSLARTPKMAPVDKFHEFLAERGKGGPRDLSAGETPGDQLWQAKPVIDQVKAKVAGEALDEAVTASAESKTRQRSPELYEKYLEAHGDQGTVHVPAQAILDLYESERKVPMPGDGLFGFLPGLADKATLAAESGAELKIPITKYVAHVDEAVHEKLKDVVRVQENGVTREEAKTIKEEQAKIEAYHGTPHDFEQFDLTKIGTGEGAQVYGHGLYFAENKAVGVDYKDKIATDESVRLARQRLRSANGDKEVAISKLQEDRAFIPAESTGELAQIDAAIKHIKDGTTEGQLYKVQIAADPTHFLDWDKPFNEQTPEVQAAILKINQDKLEGYYKFEKMTGGEFHDLLAEDLKTNKKSAPDTNGFYTFDSGKEAAAKALAEAGIPGIKYLDQGSRPGPGAMTSAGMKLETPPKTHNFVVFDDKLVKIIEKNDNPIVQAVEAATEAAKISLGLRPIQNFLTPLFKDGEAVNITAPEFKRYADLIDRAQEHVLTKAVALAKREAAKRLTPEWKANEERTRAEVEAEITSSPAYLADRYFNFDKGMLPNGKRILSSHFKPMGEVLADEWAPIFGFESGAEMSRAVIARELAREEAGKGPKWQLKEEVAGETAARMEEKYGKLADNIALEASEAALAEYNVDLLATEFKMLAKLDGREPPLSREEIVEGYKSQFDRSTASEVSYEQWRRAAEKGGREAEKALLKKDYAEAFDAKQRQMKAFVLAREAKAFEKEVARAEKLFDKYASEVNLPAVDQAYTDQIHRLLQQFGIETKRTVENTDYNLRNPLPDNRPNTLSNFIDYANRNGSLIPEAVLPRKPLDKLSVDEFRDLTTMIKSLDHNGREAMRIEIAGKRESFFEVIDKIAKNLDTIEKADFDPEAKGAKSALRMVGRAVDSRLRKAENLIDFIDKADPLGPFNSSVLRPLIEGEQAKGDMITKLAKMAKELPGDRDWGKALDNLTTNNELLDWETGKPMKLTNENKIAIALNYLNKSNRRVMLEGYKWAEPEVEAYLRRELTPMDKAMVDGIHGLFEPLAPLVEKATSSRAGVAIPLIEGTPFEGMKGGYYPLVEDPRFKLLNKQVETDLFQKTKFDPLPTAPALKQRTGKIYPVDLTISQLHSRLSQTAHAVFMQDPVINANKVISNQFVREGLYKGFGPEYVTMMDKWLRDIADNGGSDIGFRDDKAVWLSRNLRQNVTTMLMGWKASTALIHGGSAGASSIYENFKLNMEGENAGKSMVLAPARLVQNIKELGLGQFLPDAARRFFGSQSNAFDMIDFVMERSGEMRNRQRSLQKDFGFQLDKITNANVIDDLAKLRTVHQTYAMSLVSYLDMLTATPVWKAAYDHAIVEKGMAEKDAIYTADKAVREAHGSASLVSRANIGRGELNKWLTIAYNGYWNHNYNKLIQASKELGSDNLSTGQKVAIGAAFTTAMIIAPALVHHAVRGQEAESFGGLVASALISQFGGMVPLVNTLTYSMIHNRDPSVSPLDEVLKSITNLVRDQKASNPKHTIKHAFQAEGYLTGLPPTNQAIDTFSFMNDVLYQKQDPKGVQEWARGLMTGSSQPKVHR